MPCFHPIPAYRHGGGISFASHVHNIRIPCGQCIGCRLEYSRKWAMRCVAESKMHSANSFLTLTYSDDNIPEHGSLVPRHLQLFFKRLRKQIGSFRYYSCGEYGDLFGRPHYHVALFGHDFSDSRFRIYSSRTSLFTSPVLEKAWGFGNVSIGELNFETAAYVARYVTKKVNGPAARDHYLSSVDPDTGECFYRYPEFSRMSLKPGIGAPWFDKWYEDFLSRDYVVMRGRKMRAPRYFDRLALRAFPERAEALFALRPDPARMADNSRRRLAVRESVVTSAFSQLKR